MKLLPNKKKIIKSYSFLSMAANFLIALSVSGLSVLGVLSSELAFPILVGCALFLGLLGVAGRFVDQNLDDVMECDKEEKDAD